MAVKKTAHKNSRQKKVLNMVGDIRNASYTNIETQEIRHGEDAIRRQFIVIKKDYNRLMNDVATGYGMIKNWVEMQAVNRGEMLKARFIKN